VTTSAFAIFPVIYATLGKVFLASSKSYNCYLIFRRSVKAAEFPLILPVLPLVPQKREPSLHEGTELHMDRDIQDIIVAKALDGHDFNEIARGLSTVIRDNGSPYWNAMQVEAAFEQLRRKNGERRSDVWLYWTVCPHAHLRFRLHRHDKEKRLYERIDMVLKWY